MPTMNFQFGYKYIEINFNENLNPITLAKYFCFDEVLRSTHTHMTHPTSINGTELNRQIAAAVVIVCSVNINTPNSLFANTHNFD